MVKKIYSFSHNISRKNIRNMNKDCGSRIARRSFDSVGQGNHTHLLTDIHGNTCVKTLTRSRDDDREILRTRRQPHTLRCAFFLPFPFHHTLPPSFLHASQQGANFLSLSFSPSLPSQLLPALALQPPYQPFTRHGSGLMADGAIGFLQKRKRSSRKGAERAIGAVFVTLSLSLFLSLTPLYALFLR